MIRINQINVSYQNGHPALRDVSFQINQGETVGLIGANGAGKSSLIKTLVGILLPENGSIEIDDLSVNKNMIRKIRESVGVVFQNPEDQLFMSSVYDDIAFGIRNMGIDESEVRERVQAVLKTLGIERLMDQNSSKLSGGEQRLVAIATVMVMKPDYVIFDEPTSFLDPKTRRKLIGLLKEYEVTKLIATHDLDMALELCDRVIVLKEGKVFLQGNAKEVLSNQEMMEAAELELPFCLQKRPGE